MNKSIQIGVFALGIFIFQATNVHATDYNYLPPDVLIKQQEAQSALEYRLQKLEASVSSDSSASIASLKSRISQLESERTTEKNYISGVYAQSGIANQLEAKLAEIDAKYDSHISSLKSQLSKLESSSSSQSNNESEIQSLKLQIAQLKDKIATQELQVSEQALEKYQTKYEYSDAEVYEVFTYIDALALQDSSKLFQRIKVNNPEVASRVVAFYNQKYPHGKPGTAINDEYLASLPKTTAPTPTKTQAGVAPTVVPKEVATTAKDSVPAEWQIPPTPEPVITPPVEPKPTFIQKVMSFFSRWFFGGK
ncbi:MAG: hypothetical protein ABA06_01125 [Parcubacteria bacterium C7867-001]|nr:MAG: hypothetical protein ABA06_01125 [Parcubacteria bacterium C7867-001]